jgi:hypothetical protein
MLERRELERRQLMVPEWFEPLGARGKLHAGFSVVGLGRGAADARGCWRKA